MKLVFILGDAAVGKMTVGQELLRFAQTAFVPITIRTIPIPEWS